MSGWDDLEDVTNQRIPDDVAEQLLSTAGSGIEPDSSVANLSALLRSARGPAEPSELAGMPDIVAAFQDAVVATPAGQTTARKRPMKKLLTGKALATIGAITLVSAGTAAAAGVLPTPWASPRAETAVSSHSAGVSIAGDHVAATHASDDEATDDADESTEATEATEATDDEVTDESADATEAADEAADDSTTEGSGPDVNGPAKFGLCTAYAAQTKNDDAGDDEASDTTAAPIAAEPATETTLAPPFQALTDAATGAGQTVEEFCADATPGKSAAAPGHGDDNPSATAPGKGGDHSGKPNP